MSSASRGGAQQRKTKQVVPTKDTTWFEAQYGLKLSAAKGLNSELHPHILSYAPGSPACFLAPLTSRKITVCRSWSQWLGHLTQLAYPLGLTFLLGYNVIPNSYPKGTFGGGSPCGPDNGVNVAMCQLTTNLERAVSEFRFLIAFILAGFVARAVHMWATRRKNYAALCGSTRELSVLMGSFLPLPPTTKGSGASSTKEGEDDNAMRSIPTILEARQTLARWIILAYELAVLKSRGLMDDEIQGKTYLEERDLLEPAEWDALIAGDRHTTVYFWIQSYMVHLEQLGVVHSAYVLSYSQAVGRARAQANDLMSSLDRDLPFPYVNLCYILVCLNVLIFTTYKGVLWSTWLFQHGDNLVNQPVFWVDLGVTFAWNLSYTSLYQLCYVLYNPFGSDKISVAHETIGGGLRKLADQLASATTCVPVELAQSAAAVQKIQEGEGEKDNANKVVVNNNFDERTGRRISC